MGVTALLPVNRPLQGFRQDAGPWGDREKSAAATGQVPGAAQERGGRCLVDVEVGWVLAALRREEVGRGSERQESERRVEGRP